MVEFQCPRLSVAIFRTLAFYLSWFDTHGRIARPFLPIVACEANISVARLFPRFLFHQDVANKCGTILPYVSEELPERKSCFSYILVVLLPERSFGKRRGVFPPEIATHDLVAGTAR